MILGVLLSFAALAVVSSIIGCGETGTDDPVDDEGSPDVTGSGGLRNGSVGDDRFFGKGDDDVIFEPDGDDVLFGSKNNTRTDGGNDVLRGWGRK